MTLSFHEATTLARAMCCVGLWQPIGKNTAVNHSDLIHPNGYENCCTRTCQLMGLNTFVNAVAWVHKVTVHHDNETSVHQSMTYEGWSAPEARSFTHQHLKRTRKLTPLLCQAMGKHMCHLLGTKQLWIQALLGVVSVYLSGPSLVAWCFSCIW